MANTDLIDSVFSRITAENLEMSHWALAEPPEGQVYAPLEACGTTMCFAGHTIVAAGERIRWDKRERWNALLGRHETFYAADYTTEGHPIEDRAQQLLELNTDEAHAIFHATTIGSDVDRLRKHVDRVLLNGGEYWEDDDDDYEEDYDF